MKKVLIVYKFLPHYRIDFYQHLKKNLEARGIKLYLIYGNSSERDALKKDEAQLDWGIYIRNRRFYLGKTEILWQPCLKHLRDKDMIIVQPENKLILNYYLMFFRRLLRVKFALWGHVFHMQDDVNSLRNKFKYPFLHLCDWWFAYTIGSKQFLIKKNYPEYRITTVQNAIDTINLASSYRDISNDEVQKLKEHLGITEGEVAIFCGGMYPDKDFDFILRSCFLIRKEIPTFQMLFVGAGIEAIKIIEAAKANDWIYYIGPKFGRERLTYFKLASVQLMPRLVGLCILDSFATETPIVTTDHPFHGPEIDYLENGVNGLITKDDLDIYTAGVINLLKTRQYFHLAKAGRISAQKYTVETMAENFTEGIVACLNSN